MLRRKERMRIPAFDTYQYAKELKEAGFNEKQAEVEVNLQREVIDVLMTEKFATKQDVIFIKNELKQELSEFRDEFKQEISEIRTDVAQQKIFMEGKFKHLDWMLGFLLTDMVATLFKLIFHS